MNLWSLGVSKMKVLDSAGGKVSKEEGLKRVLEDIRLRIEL